MMVEGQHPGEFLLSEAGFHRSRSAVTVGASQGIKPGTILSLVADPASITATASAGADNAGDATIAISSTAVSEAVRPGRYKGVAISATTVSWEDVTGHYVGTSTHGVAFDGVIKFTVIAGENPNTEGDEFYIDVEYSSSAWRHVAYEPGSEGQIAGIALYPAKTSAAGTGRIAAIVRDAEVHGNCISWPEGITANERTLAVQALRRLGIIVRLRP